LSSSIQEISDDKLALNSSSPELLRVLVFENHSLILERLGHFIGYKLGS